MMKLRSGLVCVAVTCCAAASTADEGAAGARALFYDPHSGAAVGTSAPPSHAPEPIPGSPKGVEGRPSRGKDKRGKDKPGEAEAASPGALSAAAATGVRYYMELLGEHGQLLRVNTSRVFHSGERFRFKLESNVDGRLTIVQSQNDGPFQGLFPDARVNNGSDRVQARVTTALPSETGWFRFDDQPGEIRLMVMVVPDPAPGGSGTPGGARPGLATGPMVASRDPVAEATAIAAAQRRGSRALVVEEDASAVEPAMYAAAVPQRNAPAELAIEIRLRHER